MFLEPALCARVPTFAGRAYHSVVIHLFITTFFGSLATFATWRHAAAAHGRRVRLVRGLLYDAVVFATEEEDAADTPEAAAGGAAGRGKRRANMDAKNARGEEGGLARNATAGTGRRPAARC